MNALILFCFIATAFCYFYFVIFEVRNTIIEKLTNYYIYSDHNFAKKSKRTTNDWDSLDHGNFFKKWPLIFVLLMKSYLIIGVPFFAALFAVFIFGKVPINSDIESNINIQIMINTIVCYYLFAFIGIIYHVFSLKKYKEKASENKSYWEAKSILMR
jgi:hypothetical protein